MLLSVLDIASTHKKGHNLGKQECQKESKKQQFGMKNLIFPTGNYN